MSKEKNLRHDIRNLCRHSITASQNCIPWDSGCYVCRLHTYLSSCHSWEGTDVTLRKTWPARSTGPTGLRGVAKLYTNCVCACIYIYIKLQLCWKSENPLQFFLHDVNDVHSTHNTAALLSITLTNSGYQSAHFKILLLTTASLQ